MVASRGRQHKERIPRIDKYKISVLPIVTIYGGNASGKTNFFKALFFVKNFVLDGTKPDGSIPVQPFLLSSSTVERPSSFMLDLLIDESIYEFSFSVTSKSVIQEKLVLILRNSKKILYSRENGKINTGDEKNDDFLKYVAQGTRDNQLFLTNSISQKVEEFRPIYNWFQNNINFISPDSRFGQFEKFLDEGNPLYDAMNEMLVRLDTGISRLGGDQVNNFPFSEDFLHENLKEGSSIRFILSEKHRYIATKKGGQLIVKKLVTFHTRDDGQSVEFDMNQESDGTLRIIDLLPAFLELSAENNKKVCVIDELDRSLHSLLTQQVLQNFLQSCNKDSRSQLLMTTHDISLMDQDILRKDEMWITERDDIGRTSLISFSDYKDIRYDKNIRKSYMLGRLGGIPRLF